MTGKSVQRRIGGVAVALLVEALIIFALLSLGKQNFAPSSAGPRLMTFDLSPRVQTRSDARTPKVAPTPDDAVRAVPPQLPPEPRVNPVKPVPPPAAFVEISRADFAAGDIAKLGAKTGEAGGGVGAAGAMGPGEGPGGAPLYNAQWVREPSDSELAPYLAEAKVRPPGAWAMVACKTIANNRVENCQSLGESPRGAGLAKALRLASWQFLVRAPRIGDKPQLGVWVRIRFDFNKAGGEEG